MPPVSSRTIRMSRPATTSGLRVEAAASCGYSRAGRRLPNRPSCERIFSRPRSGRMAGSIVSHFGPPTAPSRMASDWRARSRVSSANGTPYLSRAAPPSSSWLSSISRPYFSSAACSTLTASVMISGPMPSPGRTRIFLDMFVPSQKRLMAHGRREPRPCRESLDGAEQPGLAGTMTGLEGLDGVRVLQRQADVVQAVEQAVLAEGIHLEAVLHAVRTGHGLRLEVDGQLIALVGLGLLEQGVDFFFFQHDRQQAVLEAVVVEDVGEARRDDGAEAVLVQRPGGVLAGRTAAEVLAGQQHAGTLVAREVQHEVRVDRAGAAVLTGLAHVQVAPLVEQVGTEAGALDRLEKLLGNDLVGVDIGTVQRADQAGVLGKGFHVSCPQAWSSSRTSMK